MDGIKLSSPKPTLNIGGKSTGTTYHNKLKNLDFEHSGHTGFQAELSKEIIALLQNILDGEFVLEGENGQKLYIYHDGIFAYGGTLNIDLNGGELQGCTTANIEVLHYLDINTGKWVNLHDAIDSKASKEEVNDRIGDIETALDNIIEIQNRLIGGGA